MLNEHEQRTLHELECQFVAEDPQFPRSFASRAQHLDRKHLQRSTIVAIHGHGRALHVHAGGRITRRCVGVRGRDLAGLVGLVELPPPP